MKHVFNPFAAGNSDEIAKRIVTLMPAAANMSPEERAEFDRKRAEGEARYHEARHGELPAGTYRILEQGGFVGWHLELEIDGEAIVLKEPGGEFETSYAVFSDKKRADELARAEIARRHGQEAADAAKFKVVFGGEL